MHSSRIFMILIILAILVAMPVFTEAQESSGSESSPLVLAFYYTWYGTPTGPAGRWVHWGEGGHDPEVRDGRGWRDLGATNHPLDGPYDSLDPEVIREHVELAQLGGIDGWISTWWSKGDMHDRAFALVLQGLEKMVSPLRVTAYLETTGRSVNRAKSDLLYILERYGTHSNFLRHRGRPVIFVYGRAMNELNREQWEEVVTAVRRDRDCLLIADSDNPGLIRLFGGGHSYNPVGRVLGGENMEEYYRGLVEVCRKSDGIAAVTVLPGYDDRRIRTPGLALDRHGGATYTELWRAARRVAPDWVLITSFNEWHEGSEFEPSREHGFYYLAATRREVACFKHGGDGLIIDRPVDLSRYGEPPRVALDSRAPLLLQPDMHRQAWVLSNHAGVPVEVTLGGRPMVLVRVESSDAVLTPPVARPAGASKGDEVCRLEMGPREEIHIWERPVLEKFLSWGGYGNSLEIRRALETAMIISLRSPYLQADGQGRVLHMPAGITVPLEAKLLPLRPAGSSVAPHAEIRWSIDGAPGFVLDDEGLRIPAAASPGEYTLHLSAPGEPGPFTRFVVNVVPAFNLSIHGKVEGISLNFQPVAPALQGGTITVGLTAPGVTTPLSKSLELVSKGKKADGSNMVIPWKQFNGWRRHDRPGEAIKAILAWKGQSIDRRFLLAADIDLGVSTEGRGLHHVGFDASGDGLSRVVEAGGKRCRMNLPFRGLNMGYLYFDVDDGFLAGGKTEIEVEYLDEGKGWWLLQYDSTAADLRMGGAYKSAMRITLTGVGGWKTEKLILEDARFDGRQNFAADFRLHSQGPLRLRGIKIRKTRP